LLTRHLFGKTDPFLLDNELKFVPFLLELDFEFFLQILNALYEVVNGLGHAVSLAIFLCSVIRPAIVCQAAAYDHPGEW
jgi:hypothetical protein